MADEVKDMLKAIINNQEFARAKQDAFENEFSELKNEFSGLKNEFSGLKNEFSGLKNEFSGLKNEFSGLKNEMFSLKKEGNKQNYIFEGRFDHIDSELRSIKRHVAVNEREMDAVITRVEKLEQKTN